MQDQQIVNDPNIRSEIQFLQKSCVCLNFLNLGRNTTNITEAFVFQVGAFIRTF